MPSVKATIKSIELRARRTSQEQEVTDDYYRQSKAPS